MSTTPLEDIAHFYPNLVFLSRVRILDNPEIPATNDWGTACHETRSFIDKSYLLSLPQGPNLLENGLTTPTPRCTKIFGTKNPNEEVVIGMLKTRLHLSLFLELESNSFKDENGTKQFVGRGWLFLKVPNVLVVDRLPVPFHLSYKGSDISPAFDSRMCFPVAVQHIPVEYHDHIYWQAQNVHIASTYNYIPPEQMRDLVVRTKQGITGRPSKAYPGGACMVCGKRSSKVCALCNGPAYCSKDCQRAHWKEHKKICTGREKTNL